MKQLLPAFMIVLLASFVITGCTGEPQGDEEPDQVIIGKKRETPNRNTSPDTEDQQIGTTGESLPDDFPTDVPLADYMTCESVSRVRDDFMVSFHARNKSVEEVVAWFKSEMPQQGWTAGADSINASGAILAYKKPDGKCGISITGFVLDAFGKKDPSTCLITIQTPAEK